MPAPVHSRRAIRLWGRSPARRAAVRAGVVQQGANGEECHSGPAGHAEASVRPALTLDANFLLHPIFRTKSSFSQRRREPEETCNFPAFRFGQLLAGTAAGATERSP